MLLGCRSCENAAPDGPISKAIECTSCDYGLFLYKEKITPIIEDESEEIINTICVTDCFGIHPEYVNNPFDNSCLCNY
jgi:hypothetical protein